MRLNALKKQKKESQRRFMSEKKTDIRYIIEVKDIHGSKWEEVYHHEDLQEAVQDLENERKILPKMLFRLIRSEWEVIIS